jgi:hypothetical protein
MLGRATARPNQWYSRAIVSAQRVAAAALTGKNRLSGTPLAPMRNPVRLRVPVMGVPTNSHTTLERRDVGPHRTEGLGGAERGHELGRLDAKSIDERTRTALVYRALDRADRRLRSPPQPPSLGHGNLEKFLTCDGPVDQPDLERPSGGHR